MAKVYILCGKICSGKSTYFQQLRKSKKTIILDWGFWTKSERNFAKGILRFSRN